MGATDLNILDTVRRWLWPLGYDVAPFNAGEHPVARRRRLLEVYGIDLVLDVGANSGQFGMHLRRDLGYRGEIVSFEPLSAAFVQLQAAAARDGRWRTRQLALGEAAGRQEIHIAGNSESSSLLAMLPLHEQAAPYSAYTGAESVQVETLDALFDDLRGSARNVFLKIDTQGYEAQVLRGAQRTLPSVDTLQLEMSLAPLYEGQALFGELYEQLRGQGYTLVALENNFGDPRTGQLLQVDGIFHRFRAS